MIVGVVLSGLADRYRLPGLVHVMPDGARVALVVREETTFVPDGDMLLTAHDVLLVAVAPGTAPATLVAWATDPQAD